MDTVRCVGADLARRFVDALNAENSEEAAALLAEDVEVVFPQGTVRGRDEWKSRRSGGDEHLQEHVRASDYQEIAGGVDLVGHYVVVWTESGEVAREQPVRIRFELADGLISRLEFLPG